MNVGILEELRARIQTLAAGIVLPARHSSYRYTSRNPECSKHAEGLRESLRDDFSMEAQQQKEEDYFESQQYHDDELPPRPPATWQPAIGPLVGKLQEVAKACYTCKKKVEASHLDKFGLGLAGNGLRQIAM